MNGSISLSLVMGLSIASVVGCRQPSTESVPHSDAATASTEEEVALSHREQLGRLKFRRDKLVRAIERLERDRKETIGRLRSDGVQSASDLADHPEAHLVAQELTHVVGQIRRLEKTVSEFDRAIHRFEAVVRHVDRQTRLAQSAPSDADLERLSTAFHEAEDQLRPDMDTPIVDAVEIETVLNTELSNTEQ